MKNNKGREKKGTLKAASKACVCVIDMHRRELICGLNEDVNVYKELVKK